MCDDDRGAALGEALEGGLHEALAHRVQGARGLVEEQQAGVLQERARDGDALLLAAAQLHTALTHLRAVAFRKLLNEAVSIGSLCSRFYFSVSGARAPNGDVVMDRRGKQRRLLAYEAHLCPVPSSEL